MNFQKKNNIVLCVHRKGYCHESVTDNKLGIKGAEYCIGCEINKQKDYSFSLFPKNNLRRLFFVKNFRL